MSAFVDGDSGGFTAEEYADVVLCLNTLLSIRAGSQPLNRDLGIDYDKVVGYPMNVAKNMLAVEIVEKVNRFEPRVKVQTITYTFDDAGQLEPHVHFVKA